MTWNAFELLKSHFSAKYLEFITWMDAAALPSPQSFREMMQQSEFPLEITTEEVAWIQETRIHLQTFLLRSGNECFSPVWCDWTDLLLYLYHIVETETEEHVSYPLAKYCFNNTFQAKRSFSWPPLMLVSIGNGLQLSSFPPLWSKKGRGGGIQ